MANKVDGQSLKQNVDSMETNVSMRQIPVKVGTEAKVFEIALWVMGIVPGVIFWFMKQNAQRHFDQLEQRIQGKASQIDTYLDQRVIVLQSCAKLMERAIGLDKETYERIAEVRAGESTDSMMERIVVALEQYPELRAHDEITEAMKQNLYLQREITAARQSYNDTIEAWNRDIFDWPTKKIVAARNGYTTKIPFSVSRDIRERARNVLF